MNCICLYRGRHTLCRAVVGLISMGMTYGWVRQSHFFIFGKVFGCVFGRAARKKSKNAMLKLDFQGNERPSGKKITISPCARSGCWARNTRCMEGIGVNASRKAVEPL